MSFEVTKHEWLDRRIPGAEDGGVPRLGSNERVVGYVEGNQNRLSQQDSSLSGVGELIEPVDSHEPESRLGAEYHFLVG